MTFTKADSFVFCDYNVTLRAIRRQDRIDRWVARAKRALDAFLMLCGIVAIIGINAGCDPGRGERDALGPELSTSIACSGTAVLSGETWTSYCDGEGNKWGLVEWYIQFPSNVIASPAPFSRLHVFSPPNCVNQCSLYGDPDTNPVLTSTHLGNGLWYYAAEIPYANWCIAGGLNVPTTVYRRISSTWHCTEGSGNTFENCAVKGFPAIYCLPCNCPHEEGPTRHETIRLLAREAAKP